MFLQTHVPTWRQGERGFRTSDCCYKIYVCNKVRLCIFYVCRHKYLHYFHLYAGRFLSVRQKLILQANPRVRNVLPVQDVHIWIFFYIFLTVRLSIILESAKCASSWSLSKTHGYVQALSAAACFLTDQQNFRKS